MKDLDFDELDKAVNSLMTNVPKSRAPRTVADDEKTLDITPTLDKDEPVSFEKLDNITADAVSIAAPINEQKSEVVETVVNIPSSSASPSSRRGGRFMDVVHPSSDMKKVATPTRPVARQGVAIEPVAPLKFDVSPVSTPQPASESKIADASSARNESSVDNNWPDPLAVSDFKDDVLPKEEEWNAASEVLKESDDELGLLTSPFLPDTKVEKRPLGVSPSLPEEVDQSLDEPHEEKTIDDPNAQLPANPGDIAQQLPEELQSDLMSVEADTHMGVPKTEQTHPVTDKSFAGVLPEESTQITPSPTAVTGPISIPQQYHEEPSTGDQKSGSIYDTDIYHRPLDHPAKKKSGWMWIIWILLIIVVGAAIGAGVFFAFLS